ncbi:aromatic ring-hydroxylating dioxygenase subunit alpha [Microseira sp. BLCC-F43]|jgi:Rieske 2Fe-2S family protein|uniref:aromatic ring-hydroxylating oxygenase subunit alpha n=1 Tax=Microseira sp. BLCC-F43 TaxID=3153602 RepID=UPI0035BAD9C6
MTQFHKTASTLIPGAKTLPGEYYTSAEIYQRERERIFSSRWLCIGRGEQIPHPGNYLLVNIGTESIIIVRSNNGEVRSFYNVCRHRGTRLCQQSQGTFNKTISCPYHGWSYNLDGELNAAPLMNELDYFCKEDYPLHKVAIETWEGFLFLNLAPNPEPFANAFAPLINKFTQWHLPKLRVAQRIEYNIQANWKLILQNYSECYHCPLVHPKLAQMSFYRSGENDLFSGAILGGFMKLNDSALSLTISGKRCGKPLGEVGGEDLKRVYYYSIFPNLLLSLHPDYVMFHTLWPQSPNQTRIVCEWLFEGDTIAQPGFDPADAVELWDLTNRQDWEICELTQQGVSSRAYTPGLYSSSESLLAAIDQEVLKALGIGQRGRGPYDAGTGRRKE